MGGNIQKEKPPSSQGNKKGEQEKLVNVKEKDLKHSANLENYRWFYTSQFLSWELYNNLSEEDKEKNVFWTIFPLEISNEIERAYINNFPYEKNNKMIFFNNLQQKHIMVHNINNALTHIGLVKRDIPSNKFIIKNGNNFLLTKKNLGHLDNSVNSFKFNLLNNLGIICYEYIFSFFNYEMSDDNLIKNFLSTTIVCSQRLFSFFNIDYQDYIKQNFIKFKNNPFSLSTLKSMLLFDFAKEPIYLTYFLNDINEKDFDVIIMNMFLESCNLARQIADFSSTCCKKNVQYTTFYLCLLYILITKRKQNNQSNIFINNNEEDIKIITKQKDSINTKKLIKTYAYFPINYIKNFYVNNYYFSQGFIITSKNKFNNISSLDKKIEKDFMEIEIRIPPKYYESNLHPIFNIDEFDIGKYSLYNEKNIIFSSNSVFKCIYIDKINNKIIFKFIRNATWNPLLYLTRENKKLFGIVEDGFRYLTEEQRKQIFIARIKNKEIKFIYGLSNLRELELYDDSEPKADISVFTSYFNQFKKLKCLTIIGNNMSNKECASLSNGLKFLKELKILNLSFNSLTDNNISKLTFNIYNKIEALNLKSNSITEQSLEVFKDELSKLKNLKEFNILDNQFGDQGFYHLLQSFVWLTELRVLIIANCNISNNGINKFYDMMKLNQNFLKKLEIINLTSNVMSDKCLPTFINIIKNLPNLRRFSITQAQITNKGMKLIYNNLKEINKNWIFDQNGGWFTLVEDEAIEEKKFNQLAEFNEMPVVFNEIRINYLKKNRKKLQNKIHFEFSNCDIRNKNIIFEFEKELINFSNIRIFNFSYNYNISLPGYEALSQGFKKLPNLSKLILSSNNISDKAFEYIYSIFDKCKNISSIDMSNNNITNSGFANFCLSLTKNEIKINEIDFYNNKIGNDGFKTLCEESKNNTFIYLKKLNLSKNKLGNESMKDFTMNYSKFENLIELDLSYNNLGDEIVLYFNPQILNELVDIIRIIDISNNKLSNEVKNFFKESGIPFNILY